MPHMDGAAQHRVYIPRVALERHFFEKFAGGGISRPCAYFLRAGPFFGGAFRDGFSADAFSSFFFEAYSGAPDGSGHGAVGGSSFCAFLMNAFHSASSF